LAELDVDTMIFAIGDVADPAIGLPYHRDAYVTNPDQTDPKRAAYELFDPYNNKVLEGMYAVGWARKASDGLVGIARHDGEVGAAHVLQYLERVSDGNTPVATHIVRQIEAKGLRVITKEDLECLARAEEQIAQQRGIPWFKFDKDEDMLKAIEAEKSKAVSV
jgi:ferredoxin--NADP+ reductase